jgi:hypothetical protein
VFADRTDCELYVDASFLSDFKGELFCRGGIETARSNRDLVLADRQEADGVNAGAVAFGGESYACLGVSRSDFRAVIVCAMPLRQTANDSRKLHNSNVDFCFIMCCLQTLVE